MKNKQLFITTLVLGILGLTLITLSGFIPSLQIMYGIVGMMSIILAIMSGVGWIISCSFKD